ncbi:hypothetical protein F2Q69_00007168 [Brassica cretica]|uniref:Uncharacterized protein n=1 Tax=Brassica cretica TaxID=69181 RepID=A0A8S9P1D7_BRACR|nr:hypothetical protein F2Q69_00007168 [Brassica cretica]
MWTWWCLLACKGGMKQGIWTSVCRHICDRKHAGRHTCDRVAHSYWPATSIYTQLPWFIFTHSDTPKTLQNVVPKDCPEVKEGSFRVLSSPDNSIQDIDVGLWDLTSRVPEIGDGFRAMKAGPNLVVVLVVVAGDCFLKCPPASPIEDRGTEIPIEDRDRATPKRLRLCGVIVKGLPVSLMWRKNDFIRNTGSLSETTSLTPHILLQVTSRKDHSARGTVGAGVD